jgi:catechol 2,3-dioxygenase-like lactoylglutathione lyase family enzyme
MHLEYVGIRVTNLKRSLKFYTELLDLKEVERAILQSMKREYG